MMKSIAFLLLYAATSTHADETIRMLNTKDLCHFHVNTVQISSAKIYGTASSIEGFLGRQGFVFIKSCNWALSEALAPGSMGISQEGYVVKTHSKPVSLAKYQNLEPFDIVVTIDDPKVFLGVFETKPMPSVETAGGAGQRPPPPNGPEVSTTESRQGEEKICEIKGDFCISSDGEASFTVQCGALNVSVSSEGAFNVGLGVQKEIIDAASH